MSSQRAQFQHSLNTLIQAVATHNVGTFASSIEPILLSPPSSPRSFGIIYLDYIHNLLDETAGRIINLEDAMWPTEDRPIDELNHLLRCVQYLKSHGHPGPHDSDDSDYEGPEEDFGDSIEGWVGSASIDVKKQVALVEEGMQTSEEYAWLWGMLKVLLERVHDGVMIAAELFQMAVESREDWFWGEICVENRLDGLKGWKEAPFWRNLLERLWVDRRSDGFIRTQMVGLSLGDS